MHDKPVALVTGANKGIGHQIAKDLAGHGFTVLVGSRNTEAGKRPRRASARMPARSSSTCSGPRCHASHAAASS